MKTFLASLCCEGVLGGAITVDEHAVIYRTQKLTVSPQYKTIVMPLGKIAKMDLGRWAFLPTVRICLQNGLSYTFIVFSRKRFLKCVQAFSQA